MTEIADAPPAALITTETLAGFPAWAGRLTFFNTIDVAGRVIDHRDGAPVPMLGSGPLPVDYLGQDPETRHETLPFPGFVTHMWAENNTLFGEGVADATLAAVLAEHGALNVGVFLLEPAWELRRTRRGRQIAAITSWRLACLSVYPPGSARGVPVRHHPPGGIRSGHTTFERNRRTMSTDNMPDPGYQGEAAGLLTDRVTVPETRDNLTNCRQLAPVRRHDTNPAVSEYTEFIELHGRGVKIKPLFTAGTVPAVAVLLGTDPLLINTVAAQLGIDEFDIHTIVSLLSNGAMLCPAMARETIRALELFLAENPECPAAT